MNQVTAEPRIVHTALHRQRYNHERWRGYPAARASDTGTKLPPHAIPGPGGYWQVPPEQDPCSEHDAEIAELSSTIRALQQSGAPPFDWQYLQDQKDAALKLRGEEWYARQY